MKTAVSSLFLSDLSTATIEPPAGFEVHAEMGASCGWHPAAVFSSLAEFHGNPDTTEGFSDRAVLPASMAGVSMPDRDLSAYHVMVTRSASGIEEQLARYERRFKQSHLQQVLELLAVPRGPKAVPVNEPGKKSTE